MIHEFPPTAVQIPFSADLTLPPLYRVHQSFPDDALPCPEEELAAQLRDEIQRLERGEDPTAADTSERKAAAKTRKGRRKYKN